VPVVLSNYFLADNFTSNLTQSPFPPGATIGAGERKVVWADGQPGQSAGPDWHTTFALDRSGRLALTRLTNGVPQVVDQLSWRWLGPNVTYGSYPEGQPVFRSTLLSPTPGTNNTARPYPISINEFMAANSLTIVDPADGLADDWIELYNGGQQTIDLGNFYLTDNAGQPTKYRVPNNGQYRIPPNGFLLVWADNTIAQNSAARPDLHVNFRLGSSSGFIGLWAPDGLTPVDVLAYGPQTTDVSNGRFGDGSSTFYSMSHPTPRQPNGIPRYNSPPRLPSFTNVLITPGNGITVSIRAIDPDVPGQTITYTTNAASALPGSFLSQGGIYRWTVPTNQPVGDYPITITATDNGTPPLSDTATFSYLVRLPGTVTTNGVVGPLIHSVASIGSQATFTIDTTVGRTYRVFYKDDLNSPNWTQLGPDFVAANPQASISDFNATSQRFYRVQQVN
jgi:hypothetical protein